MSTDRYMYKKLLYLKNETQMELPGTFSGSEIKFNSVLSKSYVISLGTGNEGLKQNQIPDGRWYL